MRLYPGNGAVGSRNPTSHVFKAHLPETLDLAVVTNPQWAAYAAWVVSAVVFRRYIDREADETTFVPLDTRYIEGHLPQKVRRKLLDDLLRAGVLECDGLYYFRRYLDGGPGKCLCYRLGERYRGVKVKARDITHTELLRKMTRFREREREAITNPVHLALRAWHDRVEVLPNAPYGEKPHLLDQMIDGERRFTVCGQGRVHTNVANLPRQDRQYIRLDGRELMSCDISTSQPLILALFLRNTRQTEERRGSRSHSAIFGHSSNDSLNEFLHDCLQGTVYDRLADLTGYERDDVKPMFLAVIYGHPGHMHTRVGEAIHELYPAVFDAVVDLNFRLGHGGLPRMMQRLESGVMIGRVASRLLREQPQIPILTVHDSVLVPEEYVEVVSAVIAEEWRAEFGVEPRVKTSVFTAPQERREKRRRARPRTAGVTLAG